MIGVVVNPAAALGRGRREGRRVLGWLGERGLPATLISGDSAESCAAAIAAALPTLDAALLVGGDGLLSLFLNVPGATAVPFGVIPAGTGNDFARHVGTPLRSPRRALELAVASIGAPRRFDAGLVSGPSGERRFAGGLSFGFDAAVNRRANAIRVPLGPLRYQIALVVEALRFRPRSFALTVDGEPLEFRGMLATVMNIHCLGGGIALAPAARADDGVFDLVTLDAVGPLTFLRVLPTLLTGAHVRRPEVTIRPAHRVSLRGSDVDAYADGEFVCRGPLTVTVLPGELRVLG